MYFGYMGEEEYTTLDNANTFLNYLNDPDLKQYPYVLVIFRAILSSPTLFVGILENLKVPYDLNKFQFIAQMIWDDDNYYKTNNKREEFSMDISIDRYTKALNYFTYLVDFVRANYNKYADAIVSECIKIYPSEPEIQSVTPPSTQIIPVQSGGTTTPPTTTTPPATTTPPTAPTPTTAPAEHKRDYRWLWAIGGTLAFLIIIFIIMRVGKYKYTYTESWGGK